ncbi:30S ribosomal protein S9 [Candidatus Omnitrophota bacterium]
MPEKTTHIATGRRKESVARVRLTSGTGTFKVNGRSLENYFNRETDRILIRQPLLSTESLDKFDISALVDGGGISGQAGALRLGIARALVRADSNLHSNLKKEGFLRRDPRMKERKKYGQKGARKKFQWTKR